MQSFTTSDNVVLKYLDTGAEHQRDSTLQSPPPPPLQEEEGKKKKPWLILIHGFTGSSLAFSRNMPALSQVYRVVVPDLRGHGESEKTDRGASVRRLALDLRELIAWLASSEEGVAEEEFRCRVLGGSLGCAVIWAYAHLFTTSTFTHCIFVDQSPLQNALPDWQPPYCHKGLKSASDLALFQKTITETPEEAHLGTIHSCLGYLSHPSGERDEHRYETDRDFFLREAMKGKSSFYSELMTDHTALDHRANIKADFGPGSGSQTKVLVVASSKSGCFEPEGVLSVADFVNRGDAKEGQAADGEGKLARGVTVSWGGHWCYWEDPETFNRLALDFLAE